MKTSLLAGWKRWFKAKLGPTQREKRKHPRKPLQIKVTNLQSGFFTYYISTDISAGGMFLQAEEPLPAGTPLDLQFSLPSSDQPLQVAAEVVRVIPAAPGSNSPSGMGIRFLHLPEAARQVIHEFIEQPT